MMNEKQSQILQYINFANLSGSITTVEGLDQYFSINKNDLRNVTARFPLRITPHYLSLIKGTKDPLWRQVVPDLKELKEDRESLDPLCEEKQSPVENLIHRYPDRVLFLVSDQCAMYCRYCMRKRMMKKSFQVTEKTINEGLLYIRRTKTIQEVILSGGDPLMLTDESLHRILKGLREISHVDILRIHTRIPCAMPQRVTNNLAGMLKQFHPLFINIQFNHPDEITKPSETACGRLAKAGIPLGSQTVLLKGVNDDPVVLKTLFTKLLKIRIRPYYLHHPDVIKGTGHFRNSIHTGLKLLKSIQGRISGMAMPHYMIDLPGGGGKIPLLPESIKKIKNGVILVESFNGQVYEYPEN